MSSNIIFPACLSAFILWDTIEQRLSNRNAQRYKPWPLPSEAERLYDASDVSLVVPTVDWDDNFSPNLRRWLSNNPGEIIIVTVTSEAQKARALIETESIQESIIDTKIRLLTIDHANKRDQLVRGVNDASGEIIALVDDDAFWKSDVVLMHLLAPFQQEDVGLVGGPIDSYVPEERKDPAIITPWEVAALRIRSKRGRSMKAAFTADGGINFCVSGVTMLLRSEILKDAAFQHAFTNDFWLGKRQNTGDDGFITRWVLFHHLLSHHADGQTVPRQWKLGMQLTPGAEVSTSIMTDSRFAQQMKRWYRSGLRLRLTCLLIEPGLRGMWSTCPYMARKMAEGILNPVLAILRLVLWLLTLRHFPILALAFATWDLYLWVSDLVRFSRAYPWCGRFPWAAIIADKLYLISDWYCWLNLSQENWMTRAMVDDDNGEGASSVSKEE
ncbi:hypothetical protein F4775DRAFT_564801 [Biscogniauxia sp. FL1348]|nr:hypothetical protein F4775DRAFT_564801 [Biscogniauxia sp. FL1348]